MAPPREHTHTRMHTHARTHSSSTPAVSGFYLTARVLVCPPAIHAHLVRFQTAAFWVLGVNSGHSESPAKEGAWPSTLNFFKPELFEDSTESGRVFREGLRPRGCSLTWLVGLGRGQEAAGLRPQGICCLPFGKCLLSCCYGPSIIPVPALGKEPGPVGAPGGRAQTSDGCHNPQHSDAREHVSREELPSRNLRNE